MMDYIIVQAGGKGTRLGYLTRNKPKALVPVDNLPMLFHLFSMFPQKRFVIIADYQRDVMRKYLEAFCDVKYQVVDADGTGTCAGITQALKLIPEGEPFMMVWSDLILPPGLQLPPEYMDGDARPDRNYIGISETFPCRWKYENGVFEEESSKAHGVAGFFLFSEKAQVSGMPGSGELVRWMRDEKLRFEELSLAGTREYGLLSEYEKLKTEKCRPFNKITIQGDVVVKEGITEQGKKLARRECAWYEQARSLGITALPAIYGTNPLRMEYIRGRNIYECGMDFEQKENILTILVDSLKRLHASSRKRPDSFSRKEAYFHKTFQRIDRIRNLVPYADRERITVNGKTCRNVFFHRRELEKCLEEIASDEFAFIHGDCTFSNIMLREDGSPVLIDPRGYFGYSEMYGDVLYDWAKLYYSIRGNYDQFNLKKFRLSMGEGGVSLEIASNHWEDMEEMFFALTGADRYEVRLIHAIIWLSLTTYAWQDYDSVCGAFYNGVYYLEDVLDGR